MAALPSPSSMLHLGGMAQQMGRNTEGLDGALLSKIAVGCICISAIAGAAQVLIAARDSFTKHHSDRNMERNFKELKDAIDRKYHSRER